MPNYAVAFVRAATLLAFSVSGVGVVPADARAAEAAGFTPETMLDQAAGAGITVTPLDFPGIGEKSQRYEVTGTILGLAFSGKAITPKERGARAAVVAMSNATSPAALPYVLRQSEKIQAVFGGQ